MGINASTGDVRKELEAMLAADEGRLGDVFRLTAKGLDQEQIAAELGLSTSNFVWNQRRAIKAILDSDLPVSASVIRNVAQAVRSLLRFPDLSEPTRDHRRPRLGGASPDLEATPVGLIARSGTSRTGSRMLRR